MSGFDSLLARHLSIPPQSESENTLRLLIRMGLLVTGAEEGSLLVLDEAADQLVFTMTIGDAESEAALRGQRVQLGQGISGLAAATLEVQIGAPTFKDVRQSQRLQAAGSEPEAVMAAPMLVGERLVGVLTAVSFDSGKRFTTHDGKLFGGFAAIAGAVVGQAQRLASLSGTADGAPDEPRRRIAAAIARIAQDRPAALEEIAGLLAGIERLVAGR
jgi:GAF domain-containing protein